MFYLIRHGEPDYSEIYSKVYRDFGSNMCTLTEKGCTQIKDTAKDMRLQNADIIITSPYGRALHTAAILSKELDVDIVVGNVQNSRSDFVGHLRIYHTVFHG